MALLKYQTWNQSLIAKGTIFQDHSMIQFLQQECSYNVDGGQPERRAFENRKKE